MNKKKTDSTDELLLATSDIESIRDKAISYHDNLAGYMALKYQQMADDYYQSSFSYGRKKLEDLLDESILALPKGSKILDVGCGPGGQLQRYSQLGYDVVGVEPSEEMRTIAGIRNPGIPILDCVATSLPFEDKSFDAVIAIEVLRYLHPADTRQAYREILRVLKPGGRFFFTMLNRYSLDGYYIFERLKKYVLSLLGRSSSVHNEFVTPKEVQLDLQALVKERVIYHGRMIGILRLPYKLNARLGARIAKFLERLDDSLSQRKWTIPMASHLIVIALCPPREHSS